MSVGQDTPPPSAQVRRPGLDILKGVCILLVVFNHIVLWPMRSGDRLSGFAFGIAYGSVAGFAAVAGYLQGRHPAREERAILAKRARQILVPWLAWVPVYAIVPLLWRWLGGGTLPIETRTWPWIRGILLGGGPLWFLPLLFVVTGICAFADTRTTRWWPAWVSGGAFVVIALACSLRNVSPLALGGGTLWGVMPLYVATFWFGLRLARDGLPSWPTWVLGAVMIASILGGGAVTYLRAIEPAQRWLMWLPYGLGAFGGCAALVVAAQDSERHDRPIARALARVGRASLGLYVLHPIFVAPIALLARGAGGVWIGLAGTVMTAAVGTSLVEWTRRVPVLRDIV